MFFFFLLVKVMGIRLSQVNCGEGKKKHKNNMFFQEHMGQVSCSFGVSCFNLLDVGPLFISMNILSYRQHFLFIKRLLREAGTISVSA